MVFLKTEQINKFILSDILKIHGELRFKSRKGRICVCGSPVCFQNASQHVLRSSTRLWNPAQRTEPHLAVHLRSTACTSSRHRPGLVSEMKHESRKHTDHVPVPVPPTGRGRVSLARGTIRWDWGAPHSHLIPSSAENITFPRQWRIGERRHVHEVLGKN